MSEHEGNTCGLKGGRTRPCYLYLAVDDLVDVMAIRGIFQDQASNYTVTEFSRLHVKERRVELCGKQAEDARLAIEESIDIQARAFRACHSFRQFSNSRPVTQFTSTFFR